MNNSEGDGFTMRKIFCFIIFAILTLALVACGGEKGANKDTEGADNATENEDKIQLSYAFFTTETTFLGQMVQYWADEVEERTDGKVEVDIYWGGTLLDANNMFDGIHSGVADVGMTVLQYEPGKYPLVEIGELPVGYSGAEVASQVASDLLKEYPPENLADFKMIKVFANDSNHMFLNKEISTVDELKSLQIRVAGGFTGLTDALGPAGVGMSQAEQAESLQTGIIDGTITERALLKDAQVAELVDYLIDSPLYVSTFAAVMNQETWDSLPGDVQQVIEELEQEMPQFAGKYLDDRTEEAIKWSQDEYGLEIITFNDGEQAKWDKIIEDYKQSRIKDLDEQGHPATEYAQKVEELVEKYSN